MELGKTAIVLSVLSLVVSAGVSIYAFSSISDQSQSINAIRSNMGKMQSDVNTVKSSLESTLKSLQVEMGTLKEATGMTAEQAELVANARKEKTVLIYTVVDQPVIEKYLIPAFKAEYPWATVQIFSAGTGVIVNKIVAEQEAKSPKVDIAQIGEAAMYGLISRKLVLPYKSPSEKDFPRDAVDPENLFHATNMQLDIGIYNSNLVKDMGTLPKKWAELTDPKWKGKLALQDPIQLSTVGRIFATLEKQMGDAAWRKWLQDLADFKAPLLRSVTDVFTKVATGEFTLGVSQMTDILTNPDAPVKPLWMDGAYTSLTGVSLVKDAPHPNMAKLFIQWIQSPQGQFALAQMTRIPVLRGVESPYGVDKIVPSGVPLYNEIKVNPELITNQAKYVKLFTDVFKPGR